MANNFLEQLVAEWYEYRGYFVRRNVPVGRRARGGYEAELDVVAFNPGTRHLVHLEPSMDAESWETRERRFRRKFDAGREHIPEPLFALLSIEIQLEGPDEDKGQGRLEGRPVGQETVQPGGNDRQGPMEEIAPGLSADEEGPRLGHPP